MSHLSARWLLPTRIACFVLLAPLFGAGDAVAPARSAGVGGTRSQESPEVQETFSAIEVMREARRMAERELWPGFELSGIPVAIFDGARTFLFDHPHPPDGFRPLEGMERASVFEGRHEAVRANTAARLGGRLTAVLLARALDGYRTTTAMAGAVLHEAFHVYQRRAHPEWGADFSVLFLYPYADATHLRLRRLETLAWRRAMDATRAESAAGWVSTALRLRRRRHGVLGERLASFERDYELVEGAALITQLRATGTTEGLVSVPDTGFAAEQVAWRSYALGLLQARLLDRLDPGWSRVLEDGRSTALDSLLSDAVAGSTGFRLPDEVRRRETRRAALDAERVAWRRDSIGRAYRGAGGRRIEVVAEGSRLLGVERHDPMNLVRVDSRTMLHTRQVTLRSRGASIEVTGDTVLTVSARGGRGLLDRVERVLFTGLKEAPTVGRGDTLEVVSPGFVGRFVSARCVERGDTLRILLGRP